MAENNKQDITKIGEAIGEAIAARLGTPVQNNQVENRSSIAIEINKKVQQRASRQASFAARITKDLKEGKNCRMYSIPTIYKMYMPSLTVTVNGCSIKVPADGKSRLIHNAYIAQIEKYLRHLDQKIDAMENNKPDIQEDRQHM